jgi:hypothetical protein
MVFGIQLYTIGLQGVWLELPSKNIATQLEI